MTSKGRVGYVVPEPVKVLSNGNQRILVNTERLTWAKITEDLWRIISTLDSVATDDIVASLHADGARQSLLSSLQYLENQALLAPLTCGSESNRIPSDALGRPLLSPGSATNTTYQADHLDVLVDVTDRCNYSCPYCYANASGTSLADKREPSLVELLSVAEKLKSVRPRLITLSGGEPLLRDDIGDVIRVFRDTLGSPVKVNTNGSLLADRIHEAITVSQVSFLVSVDGAEAEVADAISGQPGSFHRVMEGIKKLQDAGFGQITISPTICRQNLHDLPNIIGLAKSLDVRFGFSYLLPTGRAKSCIEKIGLTDKEEAELEERLWRKCLELGFPLYPHDPFYKGFVAYARVRCPAATSLYIRTDGSMCPCPGLIRDSRYYLGNIFGPNDLKETLESNEAMASLAALHVDCSPRDAKCSACDVRYFCGGWCLGRDIPEESCQWIRSRLRRRLWKYRDGLPLQANIEAMFGDGPATAI